MFKAEDHAEFLGLIGSHQGIILKIAHSYQDNAADREDLAQEILAQLWSSFPRYQRDRPFSTWMYRVALNVAISRLRQTKPRPISLPPPAKIPTPGSRNWFASSRLWTLSIGPCWSFTWKIGLTAKSPRFSESRKPTRPPKLAA